MAYTEGLEYKESAVIQYETAAADALDIDFPGGGELVMVGAYITEAADGALQSDSPVLAVDLSTNRAEAGRAEQFDFGLSPFDVAADSIILPPSVIKKLPLRVKAGGRVTIEVKTAGTATGAMVVFAYYRHDLGFRRVDAAAGVPVFVGNDL